MILKFIEATTEQPVLIMKDAISSIEPSSQDGTSVVYTRDNRALYVYGTPLAILAQMQDEIGITSVAINPISG